MIGRRRWHALIVTLALAGACPCPGGSSRDGVTPSASRGASPGGGLSTPDNAAPTDGNDRIEILNGPTPSVIALNGKGRTTCYFGKVLEGSGTIDVLDRVESLISCASAVAAFASDRGAQLEAAPAWSHDPTKPVRLTMQPKVEVSIHFYVPQGSGLDPTVEMDIATGLYGANRAGIRFSLAGVTSYSGTPAASKCEDVAALVAAPGMYDPKVVNVYYVTQVNGADSFLGYNCYDKSIVVGGLTAIGENIIFLAAHRVPTTLAHELGHALGLRGPVEHTSTAGGFTDKNLMMGAVPWAQQALQDHFSLGQIYRMSFDQSSWINHAAPTTLASTRQGTTLTCQPSPAGVVGQPCPPLVLDP